MTHNNWLSLCTTTLCSSLYVCICMHAALRPSSARIYFRRKQLLYIYVGMPMCIVKAETTTMHLLHVFTTLSDPLRPLFCRCMHAAACHYVSDRIIMQSSLACHPHTNCTGVHSTTSSLPFPSLSNNTCKNK